MISKSNLEDMFQIDGVSVEAELELSSYYIVFKRRIGEFMHYFEHRTMFKIIENSGLDDKEYMMSIREGVKIECVNYFNRVATF